MPARRLLPAAVAFAVIAIAHPLAAQAAGQAAAEAPAPTVAEINARKAVRPENVSHDIAVKGYDPVAYFTDSKAVKGDPAITAMHGGATYRFATAEHREAFKSDPGKYAPQFGGYCAFAISNNAIADIDPKQWAVRDGKLYLNNNALGQSLWKRDNPGHIAKGDRHWKAYPKSATAEPKFEGDNPPA